MPTQIILLLFYLLLLFFLLHVFYFYFDICLLFLFIYLFIFFFFFFYFFFLHLLIFIFNYYYFFLLLLLLFFEDTIDKSYTQLTRNLPDHLAQALWIGRVRRGRSEITQWAVSVIFENDIPWSNRIFSFLKQEYLVFFWYSLWRSDFFWRTFYYVL